MPTLLLRFPGGRYHATPWGHHANEGLIEWPPSPWRLVRALIACGYSTQGWKEVPPAGRRLIEALASDLPWYRLPPASVAHSRHFMPTCVFQKGRERTTLVLDAWAIVDDCPLAVRWNCRLGVEEGNLLQTLAGHLGYLGRSESWVVAEAISDDEALPAGTDAFAHVEGREIAQGWEQVSLVAPQPAESYRIWREKSLAEALADIPLLAEKKKTGKKVEQERARVQARYPDDLLDALQWDTSRHAEYGWSQPPASRRVLYWRHQDALRVAPPVAPVRVLPSAGTTVLLSLCTPSGGIAALPSQARALPQAELLHRALVARVGKGGQVDCPELTGRDSAGKPLKGHRHAHLLPVDLDCDGRLDHILVYAPMGLGPSALDAVRSLKRTWTKGGVGELRLALAGQGDLDSLRTLPPPFDSAIGRLLGPGKGARVWRSLTPLVLPRHWKARGANTLTNQVCSELASRGLPAARVEVLAWDAETRSLRHAIRVRRFPAKPPPADVGFAIRLQFEEEVRGPIALGYGSHFGLGLFAAQA